MFYRNRYERNGKNWYMVSTKMRVTLQISSVKWKKKKKLIICVSVLQTFYYGRFSRFDCIYNSFEIWHAYYHQAVQDRGEIQSQWCRQQRFLSFFFPILIHRTECFGEIFEFVWCLNKKGCGSSMRWITNLRYEKIANDNYHWMNVWRLMRDESNERESARNVYQSGEYFTMQFGEHFGI